MDLHQCYIYLVSGFIIEAKNLTYRQYREKYKKLLGILKKYKNNYFFHFFKHLSHNIKHIHCYINMKIKLIYKMYKIMSSGTSHINTKIWYKSRLLNHPNKVLQNHINTKINVSHEMNHHEVSRYYKHWGINDPIYPFLGKMSLLGTLSFQAIGGCVDVDLEVEGAHTTTETKVEMEQRLKLKWDVFHLFP